MTIQIYQDTRGEWRWRAVADNGRIVADGAEGYDSKANAERAALTLQTGLVTAEIDTSGARMR
jgi:uncharacterized protein YegP (UPF0339 family)